MKTPTKTRTSLADLLGAAYEFLVAYPDIPAPYVTGSAYGTNDDGYVDLDWQLQIGDTAEDHAAQKAAATALIKAIGGRWDKVNYGDHDTTFRFTQKRDGLGLTVTVQREAVCERIVTGVETVPVPAVEAKPERTEDREVVEWRCEPVLS
jgi:hypothetical protein